MHGATRLKPSTRFTYTPLIEKFLVPRVGARKLDEIDASAIRMLDADLVRRGLKSASRRNMQVVLRSILRYSVEAELLERLPVYPQLPKIGGTVQVMLSMQDVRTILGATPPPVRAGEIRGLRWADVDLERGALVVRRSVCRGVEGSPKSGHQRIVPLHSELVTALGGSGSGPVSGPEPGGFDGFRFHDLRHAFVSGLFRGGTPAPVVQRLAGHEHLITTQRYAHVAKHELVDAIARLA